MKYKKLYSCVQHDRSDMSSSNVGSEFKVYESTTYTQYVFKVNTQKTKIHTDKLMKTWTEAHKNLTLYFLLGVAVQYLLIQCS